MTLPETAGLRAGRVRRGVDRLGLPRQAIRSSRSGRWPLSSRCYGPVVPGYTSAELVADGLPGGAAEFLGADMSTKLELLGVDVASFGDAMGAAANCLEVVVNDAANETYAKLGPSDDARTLFGGVLVGDASAYGVLRPMVGSELPGDPMALIAPPRAAMWSQLWDSERSGCGADLLVHQLARGASAPPRLTAAARRSRSDLDLGWDFVRLPVCRCSRTAGAKGVEQSEPLCDHFDHPVRSCPIISATEIRHLSGPLERFGTGKVATSANPSSPRSWRPRVRVTSSTASRPRRRIPTTTSWRIPT